MHGDPILAQAELDFLRDLAAKGVLEIATKLVRHTDFEEGGCWRWNGGRNQGGYGMVNVVEHGRKTPRRVHRIGYSLLVGPIPEGLDLDHLCRVRECWNPEHLEPVTRSENSRRGQHPGFTDAQRQKAYATIAAQFGARTHCGKGHEFSPDNTYLDTKRGTRACKTCRRMAARRYDERQR